jgi:hypothetical protein
VENLDGIYKISVGDPTHPKIILEFESEELWDVYVLDDYTYVHYQDGLKIIKEK